MDLLGVIGSILSGLSPLQIVFAGALLLAVLYLRRAGILFSQLGFENRRLRRDLKGYEGLEQSHMELSQENRERNQFHGALPTLIARLAEERTLAGITRELVDFTMRALGASETALFLAEDGGLRLRAGHGVSAPNLVIRVGEGKIGAVAQFRRVMGAEDFHNLDARTRDDLTRASSRLDTIVAAPLLAHGRLLGVLNVGGRLTASPALRKEILSVVSQLGATALENQLNFERLEREAITDGLTGLSNVRNFREKLRQELARAQRYGRPLSLFLFDIDHFKQYNDRNGHPAGDQCLRLTADLLRSNTRVSDLPARYGGEEFVVLLPETDGAGGLAFAEKIRAAIAACAYPNGSAQPLGRVSVSGGVASFPEHGSDTETLLQAADQALYRCKEGGRNRVALALGAAPLNSGSRRAG